MIIIQIDSKTGELMDTHYDYYHQEQMDEKGDAEDVEKTLLFEVERCVICHII